MMDVNGFQLKTKFEEFNLRDFVEISAILHTEKTHFYQRYIEILEYQGITDDEMEEIDDDKLLDIVTELDKMKVPAISQKFQRTIEINGKVYEAFDEGKTFKFKARDLAILNSSALSKEHGWVIDVISSIFKDPNLENAKDHYIPAHLKHKQKLFENLNVKEVYSYIIYCSNKVAQIAKNLAKDDETN